MISGPTETPSDWMTTSIPVSARFTVAISRASPAIFSSWGCSTRILRADRASARTECPALSATFTASRPIPLLAPMIRTVATRHAPVGSRLAYHHVRCSQADRKRLENATLGRVTRSTGISTLRIPIAPKSDRSRARPTGFTRVARLSMQPLRGVRCAHDIFQKAPAVRIRLGVFPVQRLNACVNVLTS